MDVTPVKFVLFMGQRNSSDIPNVIPRFGDASPQDELVIRQMP
jgi:hypothetical protein